MRMPALIFDFGKVIAFFDYLRSATGSARGSGFRERSSRNGSRSMGSRTCMLPSRPGKLTPTICRARHGPAGAFFAARGIRA